MKLFPRDREIPEKTVRSPVDPLENIYQQIIQRRANIPVHEETTRTNSGSSVTNGIPGRINRAIRRKVCQALLTVCFIIVSCLPDSSELKMDVMCSSQRSLDFQRTTEPNVPENRTLRFLDAPANHLHWTHQQGTEFITMSFMRTYDLE
jgi:hypothetical protein